MEISAPAKLNLSLSITGTEGGYHLLDTVMQEIDLRDEIDIEVSSKLEVCMSRDKEWHDADESNTAFRAARLFMDRTGAGTGVRICITKRIPEQAGLGGGSSDGAAVLKALNVLFETKLPDAELEELAAGIGADCPFFVRGGAQRARGFGEKLEPVENRLDFSYLLVKPDHGVNTAAAYAMYDVLPKTRVDTAAVVRALEEGNREAYFAAAGNALLPAALALEPGTSVAGQECLRLGARFWSMTGSGSCIFAIFDSPDSLASAKEILRDKYPFVREAHASHDGADLLM